MRGYVAIFLVALLFAAESARAEVRYLESGIGITFDGCDFNKLINLENGYVWECSEYGYTYHYGRMTVLDINGRAKLCVGDLERALEEWPDGKCYDGRLYRWK